MLTLKLDGVELYDADEELFLLTKPTTVRLEHSLISISKWESVWEKPFIPPDGMIAEKTPEELRSYVGCMVIGQRPPMDTIYQIMYYHSAEIDAYINKPHTATIITRRGNTGGMRRRYTVTSELIYFWMIQYNIPFSCEKWHLNRLMMLIEVCEVKTTKQGKVPRKDVYREYSAMNRQRKAAGRYR